MRPLARRVLGVVAALLALAVGGAAGLVSALEAIGGEPPFGAVRSGPWTTWPDAGTAAADPYARAIVARGGRLPLAPGTGLRFVATADSAGERLAGGCDYTVAGPVPAAQLWTLTRLDEAGYQPAGPAGRDGFTAAELVRAADGSFAVTVAPEARPGNWLPAGRVAHPLLLLTLYETPIGTALHMGGRAPALPSITKGTCR